MGGAPEEKQGQFGSDELWQVDSLERAVVVKVKPALGNLELRAVDDVLSKGRAYG